MESLQQPDGHIRWKRSQDMNGIWMTAYCSVALGGHAWPIPEVPRAQEPDEPPQAGEGEGEQVGNGVIAGGGGKGAPLFSRPQTAEPGQDPRRGPGRPEPEQSAEPQRDEAGQQRASSRPVTETAEAGAPPKTRRASDGSGASGRRAK